MGWVATVWIIMCYSDLGDGMGAYREFRDGIENIAEMITDFFTNFGGNPEDEHMALYVCVPAVVGVVALALRAFLIRSART